ncbi:hypothetical protein [Streptomyces sp. NPDC055992]|uniref:hypothetical protein n=1 Tax=Streptomyces sp. NPDC055992 TaxID=3345673 RepID=UPI0035DE5ACC
MRAADSEWTPTPEAPEEAVQRRLAVCLTRSLVAEGISDDLIDTLEEVLGDRPDAPVESARFDRLLARLGLPARRRQLLPVAPMSAQDAARITDRFRRATRQLMQVAPYRVSNYPNRELSLLVALRDQEPTAGEALAYLRRYALAILAVLDLMGDDE